MKSTRLDVKTATWLKINLESCSDAGTVGAKSSTSTNFSDELNLNLPIGSSAATEAARARAMRTAARETPTYSTDVEEPAAGVHRDGGGESSIASFSFWRQRWSERRNNRSAEDGKNDDEQP
jgi:hypothetical protein